MPCVLWQESGTFINPVRMREHDQLACLCQFGNCPVAIESQLESGRSQRGGDVRDSRRHGGEVYVCVCVRVFEDAATRSAGEVG